MSHEGSKTPPVVVNTEPGSEESERETIMRVLAGERDEFRHLVRAHQQQVFAVLYRQVRDAEVASELAQETFLRAFKHLKSFRSEAKFSTWLTRIALNVANSFFSSRQYREHRRSVELDATKLGEEGRLEVAEEGGLIKKHQDEVLLNRLHLAIPKLKPHYRDTFVLVAVEGKSYEEAARILEIPVGTVRSRLNQARLLLKDLLLREGV